MSISKKRHVETATQLTWHLCFVSKIKESGFRVIWFRLFLVDNDDELVPEWPCWYIGRNKNTVRHCKFVDARSFPLLISVTSAKHFKNKLINCYWIAPRPKLYLENFEKRGGGDIAYISVIRYIDRYTLKKILAGVPSSLRYGEGFLSKAFPDKAQWCWEYPEL